MHFRAVIRTEYLCVDIEMAVYQYEVPDNWPERELTQSVTQ